MNPHITIHSQDTPEEARARHLRIQDRLDELGPMQVRAMHARGGFPTQWDPIITAWFAGERFEKGDGDDQGRAAV